MSINNCLTQVQQSEVKEGNAVGVNRMTRVRYTVKRTDGRVFSRQIIGWTLKVWFDIILDSRMTKLFKSCRKRDK